MYRVDYNTLDPLGSKKDSDILVGRIRAYWAKLGREVRVRTVEENFPGTDRRMYVIRSDINMCEVKDNAF